MLMKQVEEFMAIPPKERLVLAEKLKAEVQEFRERERMYNLKRKELQDLEKEYRKFQDEVVRVAL